MSWQKPSCATGVSNLGGMDNDLRILGVAWARGRPVLSVLAIFSTIAAAASAYTAGLRFHEILLVSLWTLLLASCCVWVMLTIGDRSIGWAERFKEGRRVAKLLREWKAVNNQAIRIDALVVIWMEKTPDNKIIRQIRENTLLRTLKAAVRQGLILPVEKAPAEIGATTLCDVESAANFFADRKWLNVTSEPEIVSTPVVSVVTRPVPSRGNWITGHTGPNDWMR
jgi:hypothetical protein